MLVARLRATNQTQDPNGTKLWGGEWGGLLYAQRIPSGAILRTNTSSRLASGDSWCIRRGIFVGDWLWVVIGYTMLNTPNSIVSVRTPFD